MSNKNEILILISHNLTYNFHVGLPWQPAKGYIYKNQTMDALGILYSGWLGIRE